MAKVHDTERELHGEVAETVRRGLPEVEVLAVELRGPEQLCVFIDSEAGVDHALCAAVTKLLRDYLDRYSLEVSSPGFARPLRTREHFASVVGKRASLRTERAVEGRSRFKGEIVEAGASAVTVAVADDQRVAVPYGAIVRGNLIDEG
jgi:ribosome maturation factor RimP